MKRTVLSMADENYDFSVHDGNVSFSTERIELVFVKDEERKGSFGLYCKGNLPILGVCHSNNPRMKVVNSQFRGFDIDIEYLFDSHGMEPGDAVEGEFILLTDKGEFTLPFVCVREVEYVYSSLGHIKNLFHFANIAKSNWNEAVNVFYSNSFSSVLTGNDSQYRSLYRGLSEIVLNEKNLDEFLIGIKKKERTVYSLNTESINVINPKSEIAKEVILRKNGWGFIKIDVSSDENFIFIPKDHFEAEDFEGDTLKIIFRVMPEFVHAGRNVAKLTIETPEGDLFVDVTVDNSRKDVYKLERFAFDKSLAALLRLYIDFSLDRISMEEWGNKSMDIAEKINGTREHNLLGKLFQAQVLMVTGRKDDAAWLIKQLPDNIENEKYAPETIGYYLYIMSLLSRDSEVVQRSLKQIKKFYAKDQGNSILAWLIFYLTEEFYQNNDKKLEFLVDQHRLGNNSPLLYIEGINILNSDPSLLMRLDEYGESVIRFGLAHKAISPNLGERIQFLVSREKSFSKLWYEVLEYQYAYMPSKELLNVIVSFLCKGNKTGPEYFKWYSMGVRAELRITRLYEFYMDSVPLDYDEDLPQMVMMYFAYQNNLDYKKKSFLYHNVLTRKNKYPEIAMSYRENLENFAKEQIIEKHINDDLLYIYAKVMNPSFVTEDIANECVTLQFIRRVTVPKQYKKVILIHDKVVGAMNFKPDEGVVYCPVYSKNFCMLFEDENGNRTIVPDEYITSALLYNPMLLEKIAPLVPDKVGLIIYRVEGEYSSETINKQNVFDFERLLDSEAITYTYKKTIIKNLIDYYYENDYYNELQDILDSVKPEIFEGNEKSRFIQILISRGMYDTAFKILGLFGPEHIELKNLLRLVSRLLERTDFEENDQMIAYAQYVYRNGKYDANILAYLSQNFQGNSKELRCLYKDSEDFGIDTFILLENILIQILFTNVYCSEKIKLLDDYISKSGSFELEKAFLAQCAYDYFVLGTITDNHIFERIEKYLSENEKLNRVSKLALLKYYSTLDKSEWNLEVIESAVNEELTRRVCFPFFLTFDSVVSNLQQYSDFSFVEYKGNPNGHVVIHYCIEHENGMGTEYKKEQMAHLYGGIFVKSFILFCNDTVQYYITEEFGNMEQLTESSVLTKSESDLNNTPWRYTYLNDCIVAKKLNDYVTVENDLLSYMEKDFLSKELFKVF